MGGKQSSESGVSTRVGSEHRSHTSRSPQNHPTRRSTVTIGALGDGNQRPMLRFDATGLLADNENATDPRSFRTSSTVEGGMRIPRPGYQWFYANRGENSEEDPASSSRRLAEALGRRNVSRSLPPYFFSQARDSKCNMCGKVIPAEDVEFHFVMCLTKPRVTYNEEVLSSSSAGECAICLEDLEEGAPVARLPCLCIYHKICIDEWFLKSQTCPEHPPD